MQRIALGIMFLRVLLALEINADVRGPLIGTTDTLRRREVSCSKVLRMRHYARICKYGCLQKLVISYSTSPYTYEYEINSEKRDIPSTRDLSLVKEVSEMTRLEEEIMKEG